MTHTKTLQSGLTAIRTHCRRGLTALAVCGSLLNAASAEETTVFSGNARFRIPYQLDAEEIRRLQAAEIQLHVSTDTGRSWRHVDSVPPVEGKFTFEAAKDGEYWFSVRTVGEDGRRHPSGPLTAGLKVHIDTQAPTLQLQLKEASGGRVELAWKAEDENLNAESLILESQEYGNPDWEQVHVRASATGVTSWSVPREGALTVRGRIQDAAGNVTVQQASIDLAGMSAPQPPIIPRSSIADGAATGGRIHPDQPQPQWTAATPGMPESGLPDRDLPAIHPQASELSQFVSRQAPPNAAAERPASPATQRAPAPGPVAATPAPQRPNSPSSEIRRVNSATFNIAYVLDDVGPSGISSVDLYLTENGGRQWFHYGPDSDGASPFSVTVPKDGSYGFTIRVRSGVGIVQPPPQPGERPDFVIVVDQKPPQVALKPLRQGSTPAPNQLLIEWSMSDEQLAERPAALFYAARPSGPWQPITGWEANSGGYLWTLGPDVPTEVYVRIEARDAAGNTAQAETSQPLVIDMSRPKARIIDVESVSKQR